MDEQIAWQSTHRSFDRKPSGSRLLSKKERIRKRLRSFRSTEEQQQAGP